MRRTLWALGLCLVLLISWILVVSAQAMAGFPGDFCISSSKAPKPKGATFVSQEWSRFPAELRCTTSRASVSFGRSDPRRVRTCARMRSPRHCRSSTSASRPSVGDGARFHPNELSRRLPRCGSPKATTEGPSARHAPCLEPQDQFGRPRELLTPPQAGHSQEGGAPLR